jgi:anti-sigma factor RsiW
MRCRELVRLLLAYLEGHLRASDRRRCERHLCRCGDCRIYLDTYLRTVALARSLGSRSE